MQSISRLGLAQAVASSVLFALIVLGSCDTIPTSRVEGTSTTFMETHARVRVLPPRAARAQKVLLDDPAMLAIHERDTPFRKFFSERTPDFNDVDYAKVTILADVLHRLENRDYVHGMIEDVVNKHAEFVIRVDTDEVGDGGTPSPATNRVVIIQRVWTIQSGGTTGSDGSRGAIDNAARKEQEEATRKKAEKAAAEKKRRQGALRKRRVETLTNALHRLMSDLEYPYVDDDDIDRILLKVTGFRGGDCEQDKISNQWPYGEASKTWKALVRAPEGPDKAAVADFVRDLHGALHDRSFFESVIEDAIARRQYLFKGTSTGAPNLDKAKKELTRWATKALDKNLRDSLIEGRRSLWLSFVAGEVKKTAGRDPDSTLSILDGNLESEAERIREALLANKDTKSLESELRKVLLASFRSRLTVKEAGTPSALISTVVADPETEKAFAELRELYVDRLAGVVALRNRLLGEIPFPVGNDKDLDTKEAILERNRDQLGRLSADYGKVAAEDWGKSIDETQSQFLIDLLEALDKNEPESKAMKDALAAERTALDAVHKHGSWQAIGSAKDQTELLEALGRFDGDLVKTKDPYKALLAAITSTDTALDNAIKVATELQSGADDLKKQRNGYGEALEAVLNIPKDTRDDSKAMREALLNERELARVRALESEIRVELEELRKTWVEKALAAIKSADEKLPVGQRQDLASLTKLIEQASKDALAADGAWSTNNKPHEELAKLVFLKAQGNVQPALDALARRFSTVFGSSRDLVASDKPALDAIVETSDLGAKEASLRAKLRTTMPALFRALLDQENRRQALQADAKGTELAKLLITTIEAPSINFLFAKPGSNSRLDAFRSEFYQAFRHRLGEAVAAERDADYDYWWITLYPKAIPLNGASFAGQSLLEVEFPQQVVPREHYMRWLRDIQAEVGRNNGFRTQGNARLNAVAEILSSMLNSLDSPGVAGNHDGTRSAALAALHTLAVDSPNATEKGYLARYYAALRSIQLRVTTPPLSIGTSPSLLRNLQMALDCYSVSKKNDTARDTLTAELGLIQDSLPNWYKAEIKSGAVDRINDLVNLGRYLISLHPKEFDVIGNLPTDGDMEDQYERHVDLKAEARRRSIRTHTRDGAIRALARAPFGFEHVLVAVASAHDGLAGLPNKVELFTNAFFDGAQRFHTVPANDTDTTPTRSASEELVHYLEVSGVRPSGDRDHRLADAIEEFLGRSTRRGQERVPVRDNMDRFVAWAGSMDFVPEGFTWIMGGGDPAAPAPGGRSPSQDPSPGWSRGLAALESALIAASATTDDSEFESQANSFLTYPELWLQERQLAIAEAHLQRMIVHMFRGRYPGTPTAMEVQREFSQTTSHIEALVYGLLRGIWVREALRDDSEEDSIYPEGQTRDLMVESLTAANLMPRGLARDLVGRVTARKGSSIRDWVRIITSSPTAMRHLREKLVAHTYPGLWSALGSLSQTHTKDVPFDLIEEKHYQGFLRVAKPQRQPGVQIVEMLPSSRDDLVSMSINEGGAIFQAAARADAAAAYDLNKLAMVADLIKSTASSTSDSTGTGTETIDDVTTETGTNTSFLEQLGREDSASEAFGYSVKASGKASLYGQAKSAMVYARRREYLDAAITAAGRGDRLAKWVIRPSDLRSELANSGDARTLVAAAHSGYPNGDQPFHLLVKVPRSAVTRDWAGREYVLFNSSYIATQNLPMSDYLGQWGWLAEGALRLLYYPLADSFEDTAVGTVFPFQWDVDDSDAQRTLLQTPNILGGRVELDSTDKIKYSEIKKLIEAEAGFIRATRSAQSAKLGQVLEELQQNDKQIDEEIRAELKRRREANRLNGTENTGSGS